MSFKTKEDYVAEFLREGIVEVICYVGPHKQELAITEGYL